MTTRLLTAAALLITGAAISTPCLHAQDILINSGFEMDNGDLFDGNNVGSVPTGWTVTGGESNLDVGGYTISPYDGPFSGGSDGSGGGTTIFDGTGSTQENGGVTLSQDFTLTVAANLGGTFAIGDRDGGGLTAFAVFSITGPNGFSYSFSGNAPDPGAFTVYNFNAGTLPAGTYTAAFDLPNTDNVDAVSFGIGVGAPPAAAPEPSTGALLAAGAAALFVAMRRSRRFRSA